MNTTFHMTGIQHAYSSLALSAHGTTLRARIGRQHLEIPMGCPRALTAAIQQLRQQMIVTPNEIIQICKSIRANAQQPETRSA